MITLDTDKLHWMNNQDERSDQCAHGNVTFAVNGVEFVNAASGDMTVSAAALFLLRTIEHDNTPGSAVTGGQLFPRCGFNAWLIEAEFPVLVLGCNNGVDVSVVRDGDNVQFTASTGLSASATIIEWRWAVLRFVKQI